MSVKLESVKKEELAPIFNVTYKIKHYGVNTVLEQDLVLSLRQTENGVVVTGHMDMTGLEATDIDSAMAKMADWCGRMEIELRKDRKPAGIIPILL